MVGEPGNKGRTGAGCLMPVLKENPGLEMLECLEFHHCPEVADRGGHTAGNGLSLWLPGFLLPSLHALQRVHGILQIHPQ